MLGCQSDRTTSPNRVEELFKLYYNIVRTYAKKPGFDSKSLFLTHTAVFMLVDHSRDVAWNVPTRFWLW